MIENKTDKRIEAKIDVANGKLIAIADDEAKQASILFETKNGDIIDIANVDMVTAPDVICPNGKEYHRDESETPDVNIYDNIRLGIFADPYNEDPTETVIISTANINNATS